MKGFVTGQTPSTSTVQCLVKFPVAVHFKANALGMKSSIQIDGLECELILPRLKRTGGTAIFADALEAPYRVDLGTIPKRPPDIDWGMVWARPEGLSHVSSAVLRLVTSGSLSKEQATDYALKLGEAFDSWYPIVRDWLEVLCRQDLNESEPLSSTFVPGENLDRWTYKDLAKDWASVYPLPPVTVFIDDKNTAASKWNWGRALRLASRGVRPPDEYLFLRDALGAVRRDNGRRAVLDAATAAELALTAGLQSKYSSGKQVELLDLLLDRRTLGGLVQIARDLKTALPANITPELVTPRNKAAHGGAQIPRDEAAAAVKVAGEVVRTYVRLPK